jgi:hypothetical protein
MLIGMAAVEYAWSMGVASEMQDWYPLTARAWCSEGRFGSNSELVTESRATTPRARHDRPGFELRFTASDPIEIDNSEPAWGAVNLAKGTVNLGAPSTGESGENRTKSL